RLQQRLSQQEEQERRHVDEESLRKVEASMKREAAAPPSMVVGAVQLPASAPAPVAKPNASYRGFAAGNNERIAIDGRLASSSDEPSAVVKSWGKKDAGS